MKQRLTYVGGVNEAYAYYLLAMKISPYDYDVKELGNNGFQVQIETSGTENILCAKTSWITLSPKAKPVLAENWEKASEVKVPVRDEQDIARYERELRKISQEKISLQPVSCDAKATALCVRICQQNNWRLSLQLHKYIGIL